MQYTEQSIEKPAWETPELVKSDVLATTQARAGPGSDGGIGS